MIIREVTPLFFVSEQLRPGDLGLASAQGIKTIICNRPDHEQTGQPNAKSIAAAAIELSIDFINIPVATNTITEADVVDFSSALGNTKAPILAYCRSGMRSIGLWALAEAESSDVSVVMSAAMAAGYDLKGLRARLEEIAAARTL